jgi:hypothetical protein
MKNTSLREKGITLIALIVTIIVLLLLAGITISMVTGNNGIFGKAKFASKKYNESAKKEEDQLGEGVKMADELLAEESKLPDNAKGVEAGTRVKTPSTWFKTTPSYVQTKDGSVVKIKAKTASVIAVADGENNTIPVPEGFYYVGGTKSSGVVISDNKDDQNKYKGQADVPAGVAYDTRTGIVNNYILKGNQFVWIPVDETYAKKDWGYSNDSWDSSTQSGEYKLVTKYGGFYVGRYEAGVGDVKLSSNVDFSAANGASDWLKSDFSLNSNTLTSGQISEKAGEIPYYHSDFKTAQTLSQNMYQTDSVQSGLVTGTMWDFIMKFIISSNNNNDSIVKSNSSWGNYNNTGSYTQGQGRYAGVNSSNGATSAFVTSDASYHYGIRTTASSEGVKKNNLYDIAGNLWEWTEESASIGSYMLRGGSFNIACTDYPACYRYSNTAASTSTNRGFRPALYIM